MPFQRDATGCGQVIGRDLPAIVACGLMDAHQPCGVEPTGMGDEVAIRQLRDGAKGDEVGGIVVRQRREDAQPRRVRDNGVE